MGTTEKQINSHGILFVESSKKRATAIKKDLFAFFVSIQFMGFQVHTSFLQFAGCYLQTGWVKVLTTQKAINSSTNCKQLF